MERLEDIMNIDEVENKDIEIAESKEIENNFKYHKPTQSQQERYVSLRKKAKELAYLISYYCPQSREKSLAFTKLEESVMWANASIARNEKEN